ncbi:MAG TPA: ankyrin repeat domain-containing protein [Gemmatimonadaceae bacterium]|nr:ankyrin repeat domain-containing protein [Gemmatimonadaceae bacterium]
MSERTPESASAARTLPDAPDLEWLRKQAKHRLVELRQTNSGARLADAQLLLARTYGFPSWRALKAHVDSLTIDGRLFALAREGNVDELRALLDAHPDRLLAREKPYGWTLLHAAAQKGRLAVVDLLLARGIDANVREQGDDTYAMHWAAAGGHLDVVRRLADAGGDVVGAGDDHELEVIGWASVWDGCDDAAHRDVVDFLVDRGARHHIFSGVAHQRADEVRRIVAADRSALARRMSRFENGQTPLQFAVRKNLPSMIALLLELGADPFVVDAHGQPVAAYAAQPGVDRAVMEAIRHRLTDRNARPTSEASHRVIALVACLSLGDEDSAARLVGEDRSLLGGSGALHLLARRGHAFGVRWLLEHGADANARWMHWDAEVTPLHLTAFGDGVEAARLLLAAGADPRIRDGKHEGDAIGWAEHFGRVELRRLLEASVRRDAP